MSPIGINPFTTYIYKGFVATIQSNQRHFAARSMLKITAGRGKHVPNQQKSHWRFGCLVQPPAYYLFSSHCPPNTRIVITWSRSWVLNVDPVTLKDFKEMIWKDLVSAGPYPQARNTIFYEEVDTTRSQPYRVWGNKNYKCQTKSYIEWSWGIVDRPIRMPQNNFLRKQQKE